MESVRRGGGRKGCGRRTPQKMMLVLRSDPTGSVKLSPPPPEAFLGGRGGGLDEYKFDVPDMVLREV